MHASGHLRDELKATRSCAPKARNRNESDATSLGIQRLLTVLERTFEDDLTIAQPSNERRCRELVVAVVGVPAQIERAMNASHRHAGIRSFLANPFIADMESVYRRHWGTTGQIRTRRDTGRRIACIFLDMSSRPVLVVDLTQTLGPDTVMWPGCAAPVFDTIESYSEGGAFSRAISLFEHSGTHLDAPAHFVAGATTVDQISAERLVCPLAIIDVRDRTSDDPDYRVSVADLKHDEAMHGAIETGSAVAIHTSWGLHSHDPSRYLGNTGDGALHFPGLGSQSAEWLVVRRRVCGIGIDTAGIDRGVDSSFEVHAKVTLPRGVWHLEGLVNLELLPVRGATLFVGAIPLAGGSGAPARVIAVVFDRDRKEPMPTHRMYRVTTFVPPDKVDSLLDSVMQEVSLQYGTYDSCAWWSAVGVEQFRPLPGSTPTVGAPGHVERVTTVRLEFAIPYDAAVLARVLERGLIPSHPWEEPAIFIDESLSTASHLARS